MGASNRNPEIFTAWAAKPSRMRLGSRTVLLVFARANGAQWLLLGDIECSAVLLPREM